MKSRDAHEVADVIIQARPHAKPHPGAQRALLGLGVGIGDVSRVPALAAGRADRLGHQLPPTRRRGGLELGHTGRLDGAHGKFAQKLHPMPFEKKKRAGALQARHPPHRKLPYLAPHVSADDVLDVLDVFVIVLDVFDIRDAQLG